MLDYISSHDTMRLLKNFNLLRFIFLIVAIGALTFFAFLTAFGRSEGTLGDGLFLNLMADSFCVFRFPTHVLLWEYMRGDTFFWGLSINVLFYAFVIEIIISQVIKRKKIKASIL